MSDEIREQIDLGASLEMAESTIDILLDVIDADDSNLKYLTIVKEALDIKECDRQIYIRNRIEQWNRDEKKYEQEIEELAKIMEGMLEEEDRTDQTKIELIRQYIEMNITYERTDDTMYNFYLDKKGQCYHIAKMFKDLCTKLGVKAYMVKGYAGSEKHVWNKVIVDGEEYYFDITYNITKPDNVMNYSWLGYEDMLDDHIEVMVIR